MATLFISFVGLGPKDGYTALDHPLGDGRIEQTRFSQVATAAKVGIDRFDRFIFMSTEESKVRYCEELTRELVDRGVPSERIDWTIRLSAASQSSADHWAWFESVLDIIDSGDAVVFDFTHGFRSVPIVLSTAIGFLQRAKPFELLGAYYTFVSTQEGRGDIVDMAPFFRIERWADAVSALVHSADARPLAQLAREEPMDGFRTLGEPELSEALVQLTAAIKDVDMNGIATRAADALRVIRAGQNNPDASVAERQLLQILVDRFGELGEHVGGQGYDEAYFRVQLELCRVLLEHGMHLQAYTVMREAIAASAMLGSKYRDKSRDGRKGRDKRKIYGEVFFGMAAYPRAEWPWETGKTEAKPQVATLMPWWEQLVDQGVMSRLQPLAAEIREARNGLNHGWTGDKRWRDDLAPQAEQHLTELTELVEQILTLTPPSPA